MFVVTLTVIAALDYSSANSRHASSSFAEQDAKAVAEGGFNRAAALIKAAADPTTPAGIPLCPFTSASAWTAAGDGEVRWCGVFEVNDPADEDDDTWTITSQGRVRNPTGPSASKLSHTISGKLRIERTTVSETVYDETTVFNAGPWNFFFMAPATCAKLQNQVVIRQPIYVRGRLCLTSDAVFRSSPLYVANQVRDSEEPPSCTVEYPGNCLYGDPANVPAEINITSDEASIGVPAGHKWANGSPYDPSCGSPCATYQAYNVPDLRVEAPGGCSWLGSAVSNGNCTADKNIFSEVYPVRQDPPDYKMPRIDFQARYVEAAPGVARHTCTSTNLSALASGITGTRLDGDTTRNTSLGSVNLTPKAHSYNCTVRRSDNTVLGTLRWQHDAAPHPTLTISGEIFLDGSIKMDTGISSNARVRGLGTVYANGRIDLIGVKICGDAIGSDGWCTPGCSPAQIANGDRGCWNPNGHNPDSTNPDDQVNMLYLAAFGITGKSTDLAIEVDAGADYQGGLYANGKLVFKSSNPRSRQYGPLLARDIEINNSALAYGFPSLLSLAPGLPGGSETVISEPVETSTTVTTVHLVPGSWRG
jgi:hypothetical protein